jgi:hypothetical protein
MSRDRLTRPLLVAGVVAGVLVPLVLIVDGATRPGYSLWRHGASQLGTGDRGWFQTANFVVGGILFLAFAVGVRRVLEAGRGATAGPLFLAASGLALVVAGVVPTDPALGYPPGEPAVVTASGRVHGLAGLVLFAGLAVVPLVLARRVGENDRRWAFLSRAGGVLVIVLAIAAGTAYRLDLQGILRPGPAGVLEHAALVIGFGWTAAAAARIRRGPPRPPTWRPAPT